LSSLATRQQSSFSSRWYQDCGG